MNDVSLFCAPASPGVQIVRKPAAQSGFVGVSRQASSLSPLGIAFGATRRGGAGVGLALSAIRIAARQNGVKTLNGPSLPVLTVQGSASSAPLKLLASMLRSSSDDLIAASRATAGVAAEALVYDPGIGFGKTLGHNLAIIGRYILTPEIFTALEHTKAGKGGEIQLTDGLRLLMEKQPIYAYEFEGTRYDAGDKLGFLKATVEFGLKNTEFGSDFRSYLQKLKL